MDNPHARVYQQKALQLLQAATRAWVALGACALTASTAHVAGLIGFVLLGSHFPEIARAECIEEGGSEFCRQPVPSEWSMGFCPMTGTFTYIDAAECRATGGQWLGINEGCVGGAPTTEANIVQQVELFEELVNNDASCGIASDSGWGQTLPYNILCWSGSPQYQNNILIWDYRAFTPTCWPIVYALRHRDLDCPTGYVEQTLSNGDLVCKRPPECCEVGTTPFPITHGSGVKVLTETDYQTTDGLRFERSYNSLYFFVPRAAAGDELRDMGMNWRTNYSKRIYPISNSQFVSAATTYESGAVQYFDLAGNEVVSYGKSKVRLITTAQGYELHKGDDSVEYYDGAGRLLSLRSRTGITQQIAYSDGTDGAQSGLGGYLFLPNGTLSSYVMPAGWMVSVTDTFGRTLTFGYDIYGRIVRVTVPDGGVLKYLYDNAGNLIEVTRPDETQRVYTYNEAGYVGTNLPNALTGVHDENNVRHISYYYDASGRAYKEVFPSVGTNTNFHQLTFNPNSLTSTVTDPLGAVRTYQFQSTPYGLLQLVQESQPAASGSGVAISSRTYDTNGNLSSTTDFNGNVTTYSYDPARNIETSRTEAFGTPLARTITTQWHPDYYVPALITEPGRTTAYEYDANGNLLEKTITDTATGLSRTWTYTYDSLGRVLTADGPRSDVVDSTTYTYHECSTGYQCGQLETITDALGNETAYLTYNANGQPLTIRDPNGVITTLTYDARQRLQSRTVGTETTSFDYDSRGLLDRTTLPDGSFLQYTYDTAHRLTDISDGAGNSIQYILDAAGNRTQEDIYDPSGMLKGTRGRIFDALGRLSAEVGSANQTVSYTYDDNGNVRSVLDAVGNLTENTYDPLDRLATVIDPESGVTEYGYDAQGNLGTVADPRELVTTYGYTGFGEQDQLTSPDTGVTEYERDAAGNLTRTQDARGREAIYQSDALNRVSQISYSDQTITFTYDQGVNGKGRLTDVTDGSGSTHWTYDIHGRVLTKQQVISGESFTVSYGYSAAGQLETITTPSGQVITLGYANNRVNAISVNSINVLSQVAYMPFGPPSGWQWGNGTSTVREYDLDGQLTTVSSAGTTTYTFNLDGSIATRTDDVPVSLNLQNGLTTIAAAPTSNRLISAAGTLTRTYSYDAAGNLLSDGSTTYTYNDAGRLVSSNGGIVTNYLSNALGQRVRKASAAGAAHFVYDESGRLLGEYDENGALVQELVWFDDIPVASIRVDEGGSDVGVFYIHADHLNAPARLSRQTDNSIVWRWDHDPYGNGAADDDPDDNGAIVVFNPRFPGQYYDAETGLHYNYFRDYDPAIGRYVEPDPIGQAAGPNLYAYADGNPVNLVDPTGESAHAVAVAIAAALFATRVLLKKCMGNKVCRCRAIYAGYKAMCGIGCGGATCEVVTVQLRAAQLCYSLRMLYIGHGCDQAIPTSRNHPGQAEQQRRAIANCERKRARLCICGA